jgi:serine/threonine protein kinase/Tfp pilus assembly protein PilF
MNEPLTQTLDLQQAPVAPAGSSKASMVAQAYQEYCNRRSRGELVDPDAFLEQFPEKRSAIAKLIQAHLYLEENSFLLAANSSILEAVPFVPVGMAPPRWPQVGSEFLGFHLLEELGQGSFAKVYLAAEQKLGQRRVALKVAIEGGAEANFLGKFKHDSIVPVFSVQEDALTGLTAVCMPFAGRATLADLLDRVHLEGKVPTRANVLLETVRLAAKPGDAPAGQPNRLLRHGTYVDGVRLIGAQLAEALACIHDRGVCHRDLKPSNVLLNAAAVPMLLDFNLSTDADNPRGRLGGTLPYMAPEQLRAIAHQAEGIPAALDARADIFSLGVMLFELVTGEHPFGPVQLKTLSRELCQQLLERQQHGPAQKAYALNPAVDRELSDLIHRCLAHDPADRPQTAAELARQLRQGLSPLRRTRRWIARHAAAVAGVALLLLATASFGAYVIAQLPSPHDRAIAAAESHYKEGKFADAVDMYTQAIAIDRNRAATFFARARAKQQMGLAVADLKDRRDHYQQALIDYEQAQQLAPDGLTLACRGYCCSLLGGENNAAAEEFYKQAIKAGFRSAEVANNLGCLLRERGLLDTARPFFDEAVSMDPSLQAAFHNRGKIWLRKIFPQMGELDGRKKSRDTSERAVKARKKLQEEIDSLVQLGISDFAAAEKLGPPSAALEFDMALLYGMAMRLDSRWGDSCLRHLAEAFKQGIGPNDRKIVESYLSFLKDDPRYQKLLDAPAPQVLATPVKLFVDPCKEPGR